jgi:hypothetical protein
VWVGHYNHERPHQAIGWVPPIERFRLAAPRPGPAETSEPAALDVGRPVPTRRVSAKGTISSVWPTPAPAPTASTPPNPHLTVVQYRGRCVVRVPGLDTLPWL